MHVVGTPDAALRADVERYWGYAERTAAPVRRREPLSVGVVLIVGLGPELRVHDPRRPRAVGVRSFVAGLDDACVETEHDGQMSGIQVDLSPLAARRLLGVPMHELAREVVPLEDALGRSATLLEEQVAAAHSWEARFRIVDGFLAKRLGDAPPTVPDVAHAWRKLTSSRGAVRVDALARDLGCSRRHLAARFREHVGLPPKLVARMLRFRHAVDLLGGGGTLASVAATCGYYDQPHLDRDFRDFARTTPTQYFAPSPFPFVQDAAPTAS